MSFLDCLSFAKKRLFEKRNILFICVLSFITLIIYICLMIMNFSVDIKKSFLNEDIIYRIIQTNMPEEKIKNLEHITYYTSDKYLGSLSANIPLNNSNVKVGELNLKALLKPYDIQIVNGNNIEKRGEAICPDNYYPHNDSEKIYYSDYINGKDLIGKHFTIESKNEDNLGTISKITIVGTYKNKQFVEPNTCYINELDLGENVSKYSYIITYTDEEGEHEEPHEYNSYSLFVDNLENINDLVNKIEDLGYYVDTSHVDNEALMYVFSYPFFISLIILIISINIIYSFVVKKYKYRSYELGIFKAIGYQNKDIKNFEILENICLSLISFSVAFLLLIISNIIIERVFMSAFTFYNYFMPIPIMYVILSSIFIIIIISFISRIRLNRTLKISTYKLLRNEVL